MSDVSVKQLSSDSVVRCRCSREFTVGALLRVENTRQWTPDVKTTNPPGHEVRWVTSADNASYPTSVFGFMTLCHGQGGDASPTPRHFVRLDFLRS